MRRMSTLASRPSVVMPLRVKLSGFFPNGATARRGSRNQPTLRSRGQTWVKLPPARVPGWNRREVPV